MGAHSYVASNGGGEESLFARIDASGYLTGDRGDYLIAENVTVASGHFTTPASVVAAWVRSPLELLNILGPETNMGTAILALAPQEGSPDQGGARYTQDFARKGRPRAGSAHN